jgi:outer membrane usher protein FimD/PapC
MVALAGWCVASQSDAHHAFSAEYDVDQVLKVTGVVTKVEWTNPHVRFYVDVKDANGSVTSWDFELQSVNTLTRAGWTRHALQAGEVVTVVGYLARNGSNRANARGSVTKADGTTLFAGDAAADEQ